MLSPTGGGFGVRRVRLLSALNCLLLRSAEEDVRRCRCGCVSMRSASRNVSSRHFPGSGVDAEQLGRLVERRPAARRSRRPVPTPECHALRDDRPRAPSASGSARRRPSTKCRGDARRCRRHALLVHRGDHDVARPRRRKRLKPGWDRDPMVRRGLSERTLLRRLLRGRPCSCRCRSTMRPNRRAVVDEVPDQMVGHLPEVIGGDHGVGQLVEGLGVDLLDGVDEVIEPDRVGYGEGGRHSSNRRLTNGGVCWNGRLTAHGQRPPV